MRKSSLVAAILGLGLSAAHSVPSTEYSLPSRFTPWQSPTKPKNNLTQSRTKAKARRKAQQAARRLKK